MWVYTRDNNHASNVSLLKTHEIVADWKCENGTDWLVWFWVLHFVWMINKDNQQTVCILYNVPLCSVIQFKFYYSNSVKICVLCEWVIKSIKKKENKQNNEYLLESNISLNSYSVSSSTVRVYCASVFKIDAGKMKNRDRREF